MAALGSFLARIVASIVPGWFPCAVLGPALLPGSNVGLVLTIPPSIVGLYLVSFRVVPEGRRKHRPR